MSNLLKSPFVQVFLPPAVIGTLLGYFGNQIPELPERFKPLSIIAVLLLTLASAWIAWKGQQEKVAEEKNVQEISTLLHVGSDSQATGLINKIISDDGKSNRAANVTVNNSSGQVQFQSSDNQTFQNKIYSLSDDEAIKATLRSLLTWGSLQPPRRVFPIGWLIGVFLSYSAIGYSLCHFQQTVSPESFGRLLPFLNGFLPSDIAVILALLITGAGTLAGALAGSRSIIMLIGFLFAAAWGSSILYLGPAVGVIFLVIAISLAWSRIGAEVVLGAGALATSVVTAGCLAGAVWLTRILELEQNSSSLEYLSSPNSVPQWCMAFSFGVSTFGIIALIRVGDKMGNSLSRFGKKWLNFSITYPLLLSACGLGIILGCQVFAK
ncbi:hypothetical protein H6F75_18395 [Nodosilinea sp. FACHB-131]|uniref:hypothetical protein n=1 Tax=Cyanophyceae TaxID=3028117 RepID=UPI00168880E2|nr:hypothetical protein [Nodosilinea sp. FACHB-131]MBD1875455.1 hypothetical protein [Nodosilinea sp. FACHB-131]